MTYYYLLKADTPYAGTDNYEIVDSEAPLTDEELNVYKDDFNRSNAESYEYCYTGWGEEADPDELEEDYYAECWCDVIEETTDPDIVKEWREEYGI